MVSKVSAEACGRGKEVRSRKSLRRGLAFRWASQTCRDIRGKGHGLRQASARPTMNASDRRENVITALSGG